MGWKQLAAQFGGDAIAWNQGRKKESTQRHWLEKMRSTSHQAEMDDLRKAGLNPILTATGGKGASTPSYQQQKPPDYGKSVSSAVQVSNQAKVAKAQARQTTAMARQSEADAEIAEMAMGMMRKDMGTQRAVGAGYLSRKANVRGEVGIPAFGLHSARQALFKWFGDYMRNQKEATDQKRSTKKPRPDLKPMKFGAKTKYQRAREARNRD